MGKNARAQQRQKERRRARREYREEQQELKRQRQRDRRSNYSSEYTGHADILDEPAVVQPAVAQALGQRRGRKYKKGGRGYASADEIHAIAQEIFGNSDEGDTKYRGVADQSRD